MGYTLIVLQEGVLSIDAQGVSRDHRWRRHLAPALLWLQAMGGGSIMLPDRPR